MSPKKYGFRDIFIKTCKGETCTKSRRSEKCIDDICEDVAPPAENKKDVMIDHYKQIKYDSDMDDSYNKIIDKYSKQQGGGESVIELDVNNFNNVLKSNKPVFIDFFADWCGHCQHLEPIWKQLSQQVSSDKVIIAKYEATKELPKDIIVEGFPTIILFKNGKQIPYEGARELKDFKEFINKNTEQSGGTNKMEPTDKFEIALNNLDKLMHDLNIKQKGGCDCQSGGYYGDSSLKGRLIEDLVNKYKGTCKNCGKMKSPRFIIPKKKYKYRCDGKECQSGGCPLCLAAVMLGGGSFKLKKNMSAKLRLIKIVKSTRPEKKLMAVFEKNGRQKITHFGSFGMSDFTHHHDEARKKRYLDRHRKNENWNDPTSAGSLSKNLLWNKTSLRASIADYKRKFHFN